MTFWKITDTRMNCLISQREIKELGYDLTELTQNQERTQEFLDILVKKGQEVLGLDLENGVQSFYGAFLPDKSLLLSISCGEMEEESEETEEMPRKVSRPLLPLKKDETNPILTYQILFPSLDGVIRFCQVIGTGKAAQSRLYVNDKIYYLMVDFKNTEEGRKYADTIINAGEFGGRVEENAISEAFLNEHDRCIVKDSAVEKLFNFI